MGKFATQIHGTSYIIPATTMNVYRRRLTREGAKYLLVLPAEWVYERKLVQGGWLEMIVDRDILIRPLNTVRGEEGLRP